MKKNHCFRSTLAVEAYADSRLLWDTPIFESHSFVALPTVGALVEGWLLVVPKFSYLSFARVSSQLYPELVAFLDEIIPIIESHFGPVSVFEHGPGECKSKIGCGVDYAHLHLVPAPCDLLAGAKRIAPNITWEKITCIDDVRHNANRQDGYWFVQQPYGHGSCQIGNCAYGLPHSQLFRKVIADYLGFPDKFDWKQNAQESIITSTVLALKKQMVYA